VPLSSIYYPNEISLPLQPFSIKDDTTTVVPKIQRLHCRIDEIIDDTTNVVPKIQRLHCRIDEIIGDTTTVVLMIQ
jgi:hypothetical protein